MEKDCQKSIIKFFQHTYINCHTTCLNKYKNEFTVKTVPNAETIINKNNFRNCYFNHLIRS